MFWTTGLAGQVGVLVPLAIALVLSTAVGVERELAAKSAGLRTHALVGVGSAAFMLVSKYGFDDLLRIDDVALDPSRVAAQIVSGIGFIGGGLIFVRRDAVRGLTTAATVWVVAAVGMACGAGLPLLGVAGVVAHYLITRGFRPLARALARNSSAPRPVHVSYADGRGVLRQVLTLATERGFAVAGVTVDRDGTEDGTAAVTLSLLGRIPLHPLTSELAELPGVRGVRLADDDEEPPD
ncbi:MgtC/SapB family protein [Actinomycetospora soli]|uniref:MgtC/SapB family protein n=1 Tax=Actinomycetospora soli TaxID=2893887 RepID=UPI001E2BE3B9|nr:MgtC/SapB family protein [Actinomycetospora soli]MCD2189519.1 MgtC/SapB family protein [Actinomycetospora soli]